MYKKVVYIPLDERNCNYDYPYEMGINSGLNIIRPPKSILSKIKEPGDIEAIWGWLYENIEGCDYAVLSLDMLVYGCLINSRRHQMDLSECLERLGRLKKLKAINNKVEIHAFELIMRISNYDNSSEENDYWEHYGRKIWKYSWLSGKELKEGLGREEKDELNELSESIPGEYLEDYLNRRKINVRVNMETLEMVSENIIDHLVIPKDDTSEFGFSTNDQNLVYEEVYKRKLQHRVYIYPGADEVGCTLISRVFNKVRGLVPKVYVFYSSTLGPGITAKYEDRPINECVKWQITSAGGLIVDDYMDADIILAVNSPGKYMIEGEEQFTRDYSYANFRNLELFSRQLGYFISLGKTCIVGDVAYSNGADNELVDILLRKRFFDRLCGYGAWNTNSNTLGVVILQGMSAYGQGMANIAGHPGLYKFHIRKIIEDWAYQANVYQYFTRELSGKWGFDCDNLGEFKEKVIDEVVSELNAFVKTNLVDNISAGGITVRSIEFAWNRLFDFRFEFDIEGVVV